MHLYFPLPFSELFAALKLSRTVCCYQCIYYIVKISVEDIVYLIQRKTYTMIRDPSLREVVGPDPLAPVSGADL